VQSQYTAAKNKMAEAFAGRESIHTKKATGEFAATSFERRFKTE
jgi:hypothetical protein